MTLNILKRNAVELLRIKLSIFHRNSFFANDKKPQLNYTNELNKKCLPLLVLTLDLIAFCVELIGVAGVFTEVFIAALKFDVISAFG